MHRRHYIVNMVFFFFNDTATTEIYTLSLHDALPIFTDEMVGSLITYDNTTDVFTVDGGPASATPGGRVRAVLSPREPASRSEEHTSELQSRQYLVCRLLLEKKKTLSCMQSWLCLATS